MKRILFTKKLIIFFIILSTISISLQSQNQWKRAKRLNKAFRKFQWNNKRIKSIDSEEKSLNKEEKYNYLLNRRSTRKTKNYYCYKYCSVDCSKYDELTCRKLCEKLDKLNFFKRSTFIGKN